MSRKKKIHGLVQVWTRVPPALKKDLEVRSAKRNLKLSGFIRRVLEDLAMGRDPREL